MRLSPILISYMTSRNTQILAAIMQWMKDINSWVWVKLAQQAPVQDVIEEDSIYLQNLNMLVLPTHTHSEFIYHTVTCTKTRVQVVWLTWVACATVHKEYQLLCSCTRTCFFLTDDDKLVFWQVFYTFYEPTVQKGWSFVSESCLLRHS